MSHLNLGPISQWDVVNEHLVCCHLSQRSSLSRDLLILDTTQDTSGFDLRSQGQHHQHSGRIKVTAEVSLLLILLSLTMGEPVSSIDKTEEFLKHWQCHWHIVQPPFQSFSRQGRVLPMSLQPSQIVSQRPSEKPFLQWHGLRPFRNCRPRMPIDNSLV